MTTQTSVSPKTLEQQLSVLTPEQYEAIFAFYGQDGLTKHDDLIDKGADGKDFQKSLVELIINDNNEAQKTKLLGLLDEYNASYRLREQSFNEVSETAKLALKAKKEASSDLNRTRDLFTKTIETNLGEENKQLLQQRRIDASNKQAFIKRQKIRDKGINAYLRGVVSAVIDGCETKYREEATTKADKFVLVAQSAVQSLDDKFNIKATSMEGTDKILKLSFEEQSKSPQVQGARQLVSKPELPVKK